MANEDPSPIADPEAKEPKSMQGSSEEQPLVDRADATKPMAALEPTSQDEGDEDDALAVSEVSSSKPGHGDDPVAEDPSHGSGGHSDHGLAHTMPIWMLVAVLGALMLLTVLTVSVTSYDLGSEGNLVVGMVIATVKAALVITFFMHLLWDKKFHLILFMTAVLFVVLFLSMSITDRGEYQGTIDLYQNTTSGTAK
ncbi:MAG TPA: cytochrome C oxidase subunit IV family protein [Polyangiaceae bacterium]|nr:cytochrome C oxidase subunit IV family protein [Polyangiaceae bacterium]